MTDNPLVEAVARQVAENDAPPGANAQAWANERWSAYVVDVAAALRAIEDAGWKVVPVEASEAEIKAGVKLAMSASLSAQYTWPTYIRDMRSAMLDAAPNPTAAPTRAD